MKVFHTDQFRFPLPEGHRFPSQKYILLRQAVLAAGLVAADDLIVPQAATDEQILRAHDADYLTRVQSGTRVGSTRSPLCRWNHRCLPSRPCRRYRC
jgi:acetoin utilization deacetylase AcuC-like enzyme